MPQRNRNRAPAIKNLCLTADEHHTRLLKMAEFDIDKIPRQNVDIIDPDADGEVIESVTAYIFDDTQIGKFESLGWMIVEKRPTSIKGVFHAALCLRPPEIRRGTRVSHNIGELRQKYLKFCEEFVTKEAASVRAKLGAATRSLQSATSQYVHCQRSAALLKKMSDAFGADQQDQRKKFIADFEGILKTKKVLGMNVVGTSIEVFTDTLYCLHEREGNEYEVGKFRFVFNVAHGEVRFFNLTRKVDGHDPKMNAPHVYESGEACLGSAEGPFNELFSRHDYLGLVCLAIQFIESVNLDDIGDYLINWPISDRSKRAQASARPTILMIDKKTGKKTVQKKIIEADEDSESRSEADAEA